MTTATAKHAPTISLIEVEWPLVLGFLALAVPTAFELATQTWSTEDGAQGPIILATGAWVFFRQLPTLRRLAVRGASWLTFLLLALGLASYVAGRMFDYMTFEAAGLYGAGLAILYAHFGGRALRSAWFPLLYLAFAIPPPGFLIDHLTAPLKHFAAFVSTEGLRSAGLPISREGVTITVAQYQLLVEDACSGMNSLIGLTAISLLYIYLMRAASAAYSLLLCCFVVPIAIAANILRIVTLLLITYGFGDEVGQSFIHKAAGLFLFGMALLLVFALDSILYPLFRRFGATR